MKIGANLLLKGGDITAADLTVQTGADLFVTSAPEQSYFYNYSEKTTLGFAGLLGGGGFPGLNFANGRLSLTLAKGEYTKENSRTDTTEQNPSEIFAQKNINFDSEKNIAISGSKIEAGEDINFKAKENINIIPTAETTKINSKSEKGEIELSVGVKHEATEVYYAAKELTQAAQNLKQAKSAYDDYKKTLKKAAAHYAEGRLEKEDINALKNYEQYYITAIAFATATLAGKIATSRLHSFPYCLFFALCSNFNPRLIINKPAVKIFIRFESEQTTLL